LEEEFLEYPDAKVDVVEQSTVLGLDPFTILLLVGPDFSGVMEQGGREVFVVGSGVLKLNAARVCRPNWMTSAVCCANPHTVWWCWKGCELAGISKNDG
jgi:hypothetical protein